jgi:hypothetical protein
MAAVKLYSEFKSDQNKYYKIEIWDEDYAGTSPDAFTVDGNGFILDYKGLTDNIYSPIIGSSVSFGMYVNDTATTTFLNTLKEYQQDRYYIKIYRGNSEVSTSLMWAGYIIQDLVQIEDVSQPYLLNIRATDGLAKLKDVVVTTSAWRKFTNQFINALDKVGVLGIYDTTDAVLNVVCNWYAEEMVYASTLNPLDETWADFRAFDTIDDSGTLTGRTWHEVLEQMCSIFGLRFYYSEGQYRVEQIFERISGTFTEHTYQKDYTKIGETAGLSLSKTLDQTSGKARLAGNMFNFLPAVVNVAVTVNKEPKALIGAISDEIAQPTFNIGFVAYAPDNQLFFSFYHVAQVIVEDSISAANIFMKLRLNVELYDFNANTTYYLKRTYTGMTPSSITWTTTQNGSGYEVLLGPLNEFDADHYVYGNTAIATPNVPADGDVTFDWEFVEFVDTNGATHTLDSNNSYGWQMENLNVRTTNGEGIQNETTRIRAISPSTDIKSNLSYELPEMNIFTGNGEQGSLVKITTTLGIDIRIPYGGWREGNSGTYSTIQKLICQEFLKMMDEPIERYQGTIFSNHDFKRRLTFDSNNFLQLNGSFNANLDQWDGEWFAVVSASITPTFDDTTTSNPTLSIGNVNGINGNTAFEGVSVVNTETNDIDVTETATIGGTMTNNGGVATAVNGITGTPSGSSSVDAENYMNFLSYSGANGNHTINLPTPSDGVFLRFKTDNTILANKTITLDAGTDTIDGETTYVMDRSYDGITLMGYNGDWYIIQKKEK